MSLEIDNNEDAAAIRRSLLLSTSAKQLARAKSARHEASEFREHIVAASTKSPTPGFRRVATVFTIVIMMAAVLKIAYVGYTHPASQESPTTLPLVAATGETHRLVAPPHRILIHKPPSSGDVTFKAAMTRLQDDLDSLPERESEIVRLVNEENPSGQRPCPLDWVNGAAALSLDANGERIPPSLSMAVDRCADAIERYRDKREALQAREPESAGNP